MLCIQFVFVWTIEFGTVCFSHDFDKSTHCRALVFLALKLFKMWFIGTVLLEGAGKYTTSVVVILFFYCTVCPQMVFNVLCKFLLECLRACLYV